MTKVFLSSISDVVSCCVCAVSLAVSMVKTSTSSGFCIHSSSSPYSSKPHSSSKSRASCTCLYTTKTTSGDAVSGNSNTQLVTRHQSINSRMTNGRRWSACATEVDQSMIQISFLTAPKRKKTRCNHICLTSFHHSAVH